MVISGYKSTEIIIHELSEYVKSGFRCFVFMFENVFYFRIVMLKFDAFCVTMKMVNLARAGGQENDRSR